MKCNTCKKEIQKGEMILSVGGINTCMDCETKNMKDTQNKEECCSQCHHAYPSPLPSGDYCIDPLCACHSCKHPELVDNEVVNSNFSDFFNNASPEKKKEVFTKVIKKANEDQRKILEPKQEAWEEEFDNLMLAECGKWRIERGPAKVFMRSLLSQQRNQDFEEAIEVAVKNMCSHEVELALKALIK